MDTQKIEKKIIIFDHDGGRLGNQLWNYVSVLAYCLEKGYKCINYSFYDYERYFNLPKINFFYDRIFLNLRPYLKYKLYQFYKKYIYKNFPDKIISSKNTTGSENPNTYYLPPSKIKKEYQKKELVDIDNSPDTTSYFTGWLFRNPVGIEKFREQIITHFSPRKEFVDNAKEIISDLRKEYEHIIGIHIRLGDYKKYANGKYYFPQEEVCRIIKGYLKEKNITGKIIFILCSDEKVDSKIFSEINYITGTKNIIEDMLLLSMTDFIIGSDSTFGIFAAYYGNIPIVFFNKERMNWTVTDSKTFSYFNGSSNLQY